MKLILRPNAKEKADNNEVSCMLFYLTAGKRHLGFESFVWFVDVCDAVTAETVGL